MEMDHHAGPPRGGKGWLLAARLYFRSLMLHDVGQFIEDKLIQALILYCRPYLE
jgi:hypothetical protein